MEDCIMKKKEPAICCFGRHTGQGKHSLKVKKYKRDCPRTWNPKSSRSSYIHINKNYKLKLIKRDKYSHFILIKGTIIHQENIAIINVYTPNSGTPNIIKQTLLDMR
jgi:hypothetical protein